MSVGNWGSGSGLAQGQPGCQHGGHRPPGRTPPAPTTCVLPGRPLSAWGRPSSGAVSRSCVCEPPWTHAHTCPWGPALLLQKRDGVASHWHPLHTEGSKVVKCFLSARLFPKRSVQIDSPHSGPHEVCSVVTSILQMRTLRPRETVCSGEDPNPVRLAPESDPLSCLDGRTPTPVPGQALSRFFLVGPVGLATTDRPLQGQTQPLSP